MTLRDWLAREERSVLWLAGAAGVGYGSAHRAAQGVPIKTLRVARALSDATGGAVTITELERGTSAPAVNDEGATDG